MPACFLLRYVAKTLLNDMPLEKTTLLASLQDPLVSALKTTSTSMPSLLAIHGAIAGKRFEISAHAMSLGRDAASDIVIPDPKVSRKQALIQRNGDVVRLIDGGSTNGTTINDRRLRSGEMALLVRDDLIKMGGTVLKYVPRGELESRFIDALEIRAHIDTLTHTLKKGSILETLETEFRKAESLETDLSVMMIDLDHFKIINDTYGHDAGDYVLKEVSRLLKNAMISNGGMVGRFGGEEFLVLLPGLSCTLSLALAEYVLLAIAQLPLVYEMRAMSVTTSIGVASKNARCSTGHDVFKFADDALYLAKKAGRNTVRQN